MLLQKIHVLMPIPSKAPYSGMISMAFTQG